jgi:lipopolysaccharide export system protein LptA
MPTNKLLSLTALLWIIAVPAAHAEKADRDKPITLEADTVTLDDIRKISVYEGNVILGQGTMQLRADRVQVTQNQEGGLQSLQATGSPVSFRQKLDGSEDYIEGYAQRVDFNGATSQLELTGQALLRRGQDELRGGRISYNAATGFYRVSGQAEAEKPTGRVRAVIRPRPKPQQPTAEQPAP